MNKLRRWWAGNDKIRLAGLAWVIIVSLVLIGSLPGIGEILVGTLAITGLVIVTVAALVSVFEMPDKE